MYICVYKHINSNSHIISNIRFESEIPTIWYAETKPAGALKLGR